MSTTERAAEVRRIVVGEADNFKPTLFQLIRHVVERLHRGNHDSVII